MAGIQADATVVAEDPTAALAAAAATAPTTQEEAKAQLAAKPEEQRPEWLPEKFKDPTDLAKAYAELEAKMSRGETGDDVDLPETLSEEDAEEAPEEGAKDDTEENGEGEGEGDDAPVTPSEAFEALSARFEENGSFDDDDYALAEQAGYSREMVDGYLAGQQALAERATREITEAAGGKDHMDRMFAWAQVSLTPTEVDRFNAHFQGNDINAAVIAMEQLKGRYEKANGSNAKLISGRGTTGAVDSFNSWAEVTTAMADPRYRTDPAYNKAVADKLGRSTLK